MENEETYSVSLKDAVFEGDWYLKGYSDEDIVNRTKILCNSVIQFVKDERKKKEDLVLGMMCFNFDDKFDILLQFGSRVNSKQIDIITWKVYPNDATPDDVLDLYNQMKVVKEKIDW